MLARALAVAIVAISCGAGAAPWLVVPAWAAPPESVPMLEMSPEARVRYDAGMAHYGGKDFAAAIREFRAAFTIEPRREFVFAEAQATRLLGDCPGAVALYRRFLEMAPPPQQVEATRIAMARCEGIPATRSEPQAAPMLAAPPPRQAWYTDATAGSLALAGVAALGVGAALIVQGVGRAEAACEPGASNYGACGARHDAAAARWRWGIFGALTGGVLVALGVSRYVIVARDARGQGIAAVAGGRF